MMTLWGYMRPYFFFYWRFNVITGRIPFQHPPRHKMSKSPKIVLFDIETAPMKVTTWGLYNNFLSIDNIIEDWYIICAAWKTLGSKTVNYASIKKAGSRDDKGVLKSLRAALSGADVIVGHNSDKFDIKKFNARLIFHGLDPLPPIPTVDTKKEAKKIAAFSSNKLDYLDKFFGGEGKMHTEYQLWLDIMQGDEKALQYMIKYNRDDVNRLENVYLRLRPYMKNHPHVGAIEGKDRFTSCPNCGGTNLKLNGTRVTAAGIRKQEVQCQDCGHYHRYPLS